MEQPPNFENREQIIDQKIEELATQEGMTASDILIDLTVFLSEESSNPDYIEEMAEKLQITVDELTAYVAKKAEEMQ